ncbi:hypothetical protein BT63DRAFT_457915 [Microthyrium microscopicum]|uniref:Thioredoxin-like fold domain-containing protein n=1 Tax=Microthyrium microscopicum TaxID=703497 RepID=A0A6A6U688_9PEZI|nr:hypothetical protein BT63DRAFT_457915 [Microthyrium microscopicum]
MPSSATSNTNGHATSHTKALAKPTVNQTPNAWSFFAVPRPIKRIFDRFPLLTYPANRLPERVQRVKSADGHALFIWCAPEDASENRASFNPACLRWQAFLKSQNLQFHTVSSSNHASTNERLPFLVVNPSCSSPFKSNIVSAHELAKWAVDQKDSWPVELELHYEPYMSLLNNEIRRAWQYHMYLSPNFEAFTAPSYIHSQTNSSVVRITSSWELQKAAREDLMKSSPRIDVEGLYASADRAFFALDNLLKRKRRMVADVSAPSLLEATLFSYLFLLLELPLDRWLDNRLPEIARKYPELVELENTLKKQYGLQPPAIYDALTGTKDSTLNSRTRLEKHFGIR